MKRKTTAIISLALAVSIAACIAGCSANNKKPDREYVSASSQEQTVTDENGNTVTTEGTNASTAAAENTTTTQKSKKAKKVKEKPAKPYYVTNIYGKKITTTAAYVKVTNKKGEVVTDKKGNAVTEKVTETTKKGEKTTKHYEGTTTYTTKPKNGVIELPDAPEDDNELSESMALINLQANYPEKWINIFPNYDPNNNGDYAYFAVFTNPDKHTITSVITVDLVTGRANERNLKTDKVTSIKVL
ncbi:hypothetical protein [uncultured Eubacterium sp.]|uniref:hypothetical protein n=1 Tax=uncultured Eubacterium sp. TaxID=165185 RepID=UPI0025F1CD0D|nr:hypothetical protein [uncultured Eubacterium sp.]